MGGFFNMDGPFYRVGNALADIMILSLLWIVFSIPIITIGASTTALYYVTTRRLADKQGYITSDFFLAFKQNFKVATILWLIWLLIFVIIIANISMMIGEEEITFGPSLAFLFPAQIVILIELFFMAQYIYPINARFDMGVIQVLKSAFFMANRHLLTTITCLVTGFVIIWISLDFFQPLLLMAMGIHAYATSYFIMRIFKRYRPEMDAPDESLKELAPLPEYEKPKEIKNDENNENEENKK